MPTSNRQDKLNILLSLMGYLPFSQACNTIQTDNKQRLEKHTHQPRDWMTGEKGWSLSWGLYLSQLSRFMTCRMKKYFNLFDLTWCSLKVKPEILVEWRPHSSLSKFVPYYSRYPVHNGGALNCCTDLVLKVNWLGKGLCHWSDPCRLKVKPLMLYHPELQPW